MTTDKQLLRKINELVDFIRENHPDKAVAFELFVNYREHNAEFQFFNSATPNVSMKDLGGNWVS